MGIYFAGTAQDAEPEKKSIEKKEPKEKDVKEKEIKEEEKDEDEISFPLDNFYAKRKGNPVRKLLSNFRFGLSTGYGSTFFNHKLEGFGIYQSPGAAPLIFADGFTTPLFDNWINKVTTVTTPGASNFLVNSDTAKIGFKGKALNIPITATIHYEFLRRYRIGGGFSMEYMTLGQFHPITYRDNIASFRPDHTGGFMKKYYGILGISFFRWENFLFTADANIGGYKLSNKFDKSLIKKGLYTNIGITAEWELSEYLRAFVRPSFEIKNYTLSIPEAGKSINHAINALYVNVGLSYTLPSLPKCYNKDCRIQINHAHGDREYRSQVHPIYKKQNPIYGENYPRLIKYKGKNKKKLNPY